MSEHTFGPWHTHGRFVVHVTKNEKLNTIAEVHSISANGTKMPREANARLIAAAPEMLRLIQRLTSPHMAEPQYRMDAFIDANEIVKQITQGDD